MYVGVFVECPTWQDSDDETGVLFLGWKCYIDHLASNTHVRAIIPEFIPCVAAFQCGRWGTAIQFGRDAGGDSVQGGVDRGLRCVNSNGSKWR